MALVEGTNCGFVTVAPSSDPLGAGGGLDSFAIGTKVTSPATATKVTEIGFWADSASQEANFEVAIYTHDSGNDRPLDRLAGGSFTNAKGTTAGWKSAVVDVTISPSTIYWICVQLDDTATATSGNYSTSIGGRYSYKTASTLPDPWAEDGNSNNLFEAYYAVWEAAVGTNMQINIGDAWKAVAGIQINIGDSWKAVAGMQINIGDAWKAIF